MVESVRREPFLSRVTCLSSRNMSNHTNSHPITCNFRVQACAKTFFHRSILRAPALSMSPPSYDELFPDRLEEQAPHAANRRGSLGRLW